MQAIKDIYMHERFLRDYEHASYQVKKAIDKHVNSILNSGQFPNSMNVHNAKSTDLFIGYVTRTKSHWRVLFSVDEGIVTFLRMSDHDTMDQILKDEVKN
jgi:hypothetical protein